MKQIRIGTLVLENFKCHRYLSLDFSGGDMSIYGDNATGKTSIYDALCWLLFGRDSTGNGEKTMDIKPLGTDGQVKDHQAITSVEAQLTVDDEPLVLKRTLREVWTVRRGTGGAVFDGNTSDYFVDGVPCKKNAFEARVRQLVPEDLFRMLTCVGCFAGEMKWQDRRAVLFDMAGSLTDRELMEKEERFAPVLEAMGKLETEDYRRKLLSRKKGLTGTREDIPARISECQLLVKQLQELDFAAARQEEQQLLQRRQSLCDRLAEAEQDNDLRSLELELRERKLERDELESKYRALRQTGAAGERSRVQRELSRIRERLERLQTLEAECREELERTEERLQRSRELWVQANGQAFQGGSCPACGQTLPFRQLKTATEAFEERKRQRLLELEQEQEALLKTYGDRERLLQRQQQERQQLLEQQKTLDRELEGYSRQQEEVPDCLREELDRLQQRIDQVQRQLLEGREGIRRQREDLRRQREELDGQLRRVQQLLARESVLETTRDRVRQLRQQEEQAVRELEQIEQMLFLLEEFVRFKAGFAESSVNDHFRLASFRLFREQLSGGLEERCDALYRGVPYPALNNGMKVNVGIDIINALSRHYGVTVPLFVDNAEAVTRLEPCRAQVIRLVVSEGDPVLRAVPETR